MKQFTIVIFLLLLPCHCLAQEQDSLKTAHTMQVFKDEFKEFIGMGGEMPTFPGGMEGLLAFLLENIKYPRKAEKNEIEGQVICSFWILEDGSITDVRVAQSAHPILDKEALRVIKAMPKWNPATLNGVPKKIRYSLPINFRFE